MSALLIWPLIMAINSFLHKFISQIMKGLILKRILFYKKINFFVTFREGNRNKNNSHQKRNARKQKLTQ